MLSNLLFELDLRNSIKLNDEKTYVQFLKLKKQFFQFRSNDRPIGSIANPLPFSYEISVLEKAGTSILFEFSETNFVIIESP